MWFVVILVAVIIFGLYFIRRKRQANLNAEGKYVLITGCDSGFGRETAIRLDQMGVYVLATCLTKEGEQNLKSVTSDKLKTFQMDVTSSRQIEELLDSVLEILGNNEDNEGLWGLVNNAGVFCAGPVEWVPLSQFKKTADVNLWGVIDMTKTFLPLVKKARGRIVLVGSIAGVVSPKTFSPYCISKYGVEAFGDALRREMQPFDVHVSVIEPGTTRTPILNKEALSSNLYRQWSNLPPCRQREYGVEYLKKMTEGFCNWCESATPQSSKVVDAIVHPLTSRVPKARYVIGWDAWKMKLSCSLPSKLQDLVFLEFPFRFAPSSSPAERESCSMNGKYH